MNHASNPLKSRRQSPTDRDQALYLEYSTSGKTQVQLAAEHGISQSRLSQIVRRVRCWLAEQEQPGQNKLTDNERQALAQRLEYERLDRLYRQATRYLDSQQTTFTTHREGTFGRTPFVERTIRQVPPDVRWLQIALRAAQDILRLEHSLR